jgi:hypothetical protein
MDWADVPVMTVSSVETVEIRVAARASTDHHGAQAEGRRRVIVLCGRSVLLEPRHSAGRVERELLDRSVREGPDTTVEIDESFCPATCGGLAVDGDWSPT